MRSQHLSDEAVAAFADGALRGHANDRAAQHCGECAECAYAVAVQREAVWALRAAPAPSLPTGLLDRLRDVPASTPLQGPPLAGFGADGSAMFAAFGSAAAAIVAPSPPRGGDEAQSRSLVRPIVTAVAATAVVGLLAVGSAGYASGTSTHHDQPGHGAPAAVRPADNAGPLGTGGEQLRFAPAIWSGRHDR